MSYNSTTLFHSKFEELPLTNLKTAETLTINGTSPSLVDGVRGNALQMTEGSFLEASHLALTNKLSIGFWLKPANPGIVTTPNKESIPLVMPLVAQSSFSTVGNTIYTYNMDFCVSEATYYENEENYLIISLGGLLSSVYTEKILISQKYSSNEYHYFWISVDLSTSTFKIFIDGVDTTVDEVGDNITSFLNASALFSINNSAPGLTYQVARNIGILDDLVVLNTAVSNIDTISRSALMGAEYIVDTDYIDTYEINQAVICDDPGTVQITSIYVNRGNLYVGRSDGLLLRGVRELWQTRREFFNATELQYTTTINRSDSSSLSLSGGVLSVTNEVIRI